MTSLKPLGGYFETEELVSEENHFFDQLTPEGGDLRFLMSGRCGILCALEDWKAGDSKRVAYVPSYTCGTVLAPYVKAGFRLKFYEVDRSMTPVWEDQALGEISVLNLCGYYGFSRYDRAFVQKCRERGICILEDSTHSVLSLDGISPDADYITGSLRKWIGVPSGGFLIKRRGKLTPELLPFHQEHLDMRRGAMETKKKSTTEPGSVSQEALEAAEATFWQAESLLRQIFDCCQSDPDSVQIMRRFPVERIRNLRRENYQRLLSVFPKSPLCVPVFPLLDEATVPSHFTVLAQRRNDLQSFLKEQGIHTTAYWDKSALADTSRCPQAQYIYDHVLSLPCDQRYTPADMDRIAGAVAQFCQQQ